MGVSPPTPEPSAATPRHVAVIMDGNGRWATARGLQRIEGHKAGGRAVHTLVEAARRRGIRYLTLFSFSTENWQRKREEVSSLMELFREYLGSELKTMLEHDIRLRAVGDLERLPYGVRKKLRSTCEKTRHNRSLDLVLAVSYGGREEIVAAAKKLAARAAAGEIDPQKITNEVFARALWTEDIPDPDLLIRTSGEMRISNFLLWQLAYAEIVVTPTLWPDFDEATFDDCLREYSMRERRFGLTSEQIRSLGMGPNGASSDSV